MLKTYVFPVEEQEKYPPVQFGSKKKIVFFWMRGRR